MPYRVRNHFGADSQLKAFVNFESFSLVFSIHFKIWFFSILNNLLLVHFDKIPNLVFCLFFSESKVDIKSQNIKTRKKIQGLHEWNTIS